jgi:SAM-dependent methyltransferase
LQTVSDRRLPPKDLIDRVGWVVRDERPATVFLARGAEQWQLIKSLLPEGWDWVGKRGLDFGCGAGRILRHAADEQGAEFWGCDTDPRSIDWLSQHLSPPLHLLRNAEWPPVALPDEYFDLIWAFSVFTHIMDPWSAWLVELHRMLKPDGRLIATAFGPGHSAFGEEPISEEIVGMNVLFPGADWDMGGPLVVHSEWWLKEHWGRAFEILDFLVGDPQGTPPLYGQSALVLRKRRPSVSVKELETVDLANEREWSALRQERNTLVRDAAWLRNQVDSYAGSRSWKLTAPLRRVGALMRREQG